MQENKKTSLRELLEQMPTDQLDDMLQNELDQEHPDGNSVRLILDILREREKDCPVEMTPEIANAWEKYQQDVAQQEEEFSRPKPIRRWVLRIGAAAASLILVLSMFEPVRATAGNLWKIVAGGSDLIFRYENIGEETEAPEEYVFVTDNPGLQQVYDAVEEELGVTFPLVNAWFPEEYELAEVFTVDTPAYKGVHARFVSGEKEAFLRYDYMKVDVSPDYDKTFVKVDEKEINGIIHNILTNNGKYIVSWTNGYLKCSIYIDCQEEILNNIIWSIY